MADVKTLQTRIALKYDSYANWTSETTAGQGANLVLLKGEIGICEIPSVNAASNVAPTVLFKVGDGETPFKTLPWASAKAADVYSWAKATDVTYSSTDKTITFVKGNPDGTDKKFVLNYVTETEVKAITDPLVARIAAVEAKFSGDASVEGQIAALDDRLDVIEGEGEGSVAKALVDAKAYTDGREAAIETAYKAYADQAEADAKLYTDEKVTAQATKDSNQDALISANAAAISQEASDRADAINTAVNNVTAAYEAADIVINNKIGTVAEGKNIVTMISEAQAAAEGKVTELAAGQVAANKTALEENAAAISELQGDLADEVETREALADRVADLEAVDNATQAELNTYKGEVTAAIGTAKQEAIEAAASDAANKVKALADGAVATNAANIASNAAAIEAETGAREAADNLLDERLEKVEAFFGAAEHDGYEGLNKALDTLVEIQDYLTGDGDAAGDLIGRVAAAEDAIEALESEFDDGGRVTVAEADIAALEGRADALEAKTAGFSGTIKTAVDAAQSAADEAAQAAKAASEKVDTTAATIKTNYEAYADGKATAAQEAAEATAASALSGAVNTLNAKDADIEEQVATKLAAADFDAWKSTHENGHAKLAAEITSEITAAVKAETDARVEAISDINEAINNVSDVANDAAADLAALVSDSGRIATAESAIDALELIVNDESKGNEQLRDDVDALQTLTGDTNKGNEALYTEVSRVAGLVDNANTGLAKTKEIADAANSKATANEGRIAAIEADYLKAIDELIFNCGTASTVLHRAN